MSRKKISTTIYVTPEQADRLKLLHERTKVPVAVYIREGIDLVLRQYGHLLPGQLPLDPGATPPLSSPRAASIAPPSSIVPSIPGLPGLPGATDVDDEEQTRAHARAHESAHERPPPGPHAPHGHAAHAASKK